MLSVRQRNRVYLEEALCGIFIGYPGECSDPLDLSLGQAFRAGRLVVTANFTKNSEILQEKFKTCEGACGKIVW